jgi:hypothetical protein
MVEGWSFNPPPHWPHPPRGWMPPPNWEPDPDWGPVPPGWQLWVPTPKSRYPWPAIFCASAVIALSVASVTWLPRMSDAALVSATDLRGVQEHRLGADIGAASQNSDDASDVAKGTDVGPVPVGTLTPALPEASVRAATTAPGAALSFDSCTELTAVYPHGVGMPDAVDRNGRHRAAKPSGDNLGESGAVAAKVTDFGRSTALYGANRPLDVDQDGIACER